MARTPRSDRTRAQGERRSREERGDNLPSWLESLKEALGLSTSRRRPRKKMPFRARFSLGYFLVALVLMILIQNLFLAETTHRIPYSEFKQLLREGKIESVTLTQDEIRGKLKEVLEHEGRRTRLFTTVRVKNADDPDLVRELDRLGLKYSGQYESTWLTTVLSWIIPILIFFGIWSLIFRRMSPGGTVMTFGRSKAKIYGENDVKVTFSDVADVQEAKDELVEIVDFLRHPRKFQRLGGRIPKGVLLVGPPGTGKTLLARAVAGEARVPFFSINGSEFVEMFVGVGASRVRDLFAQAQSIAPCIVFIDELDALGKARGANPLAGHEEREQTLNQLLVEMDGFDSRKGVIILAATNRPEILDLALLRPGRFDRRVLVDRPDLNGREAILQLHAKNVRMSPDVNLRTIAQRTPGFVGADLANLVNEAALLAARKDKAAVEMRDLEEAIDRVVAGLEKKNRILNEREREIVAYHESGHALVAATLPHADPVHRISIIPRGIAALGYTLQLPTEDRYLVTKSELLDKLAVLLGGRVAEELVFEEISTGAHNDLERATDIARRMVVEYGMSPKFGPLTFETRRGPVFLDGEFSGAKQYSEETAREIDQEVARITRETHVRVKDLLTKRREDLERIARHLLEKEVVDGEKLRSLLGLSTATPSL